MSKRAIVYGGKGALGTEIISYFKEKSWWVASIDLFENPDADVNIVVGPTDSWVTQGELVNAGVESALHGEKVHAVFCVAGGWAGGHAADKDFIRNSDLMWKQSVWTSAIAAQLSANHLQAGGILTLPGAQPAIKGTPGMIGYGMAKAAVHQLTKSLAEPSGGLPANSFVVAILPVTLDTPMNRKYMPTADHSTWTPLKTVAELFHNWSEGNGRPANGSLVQLITKGGKTEFVIA